MTHAPCLSSPYREDQDRGGQEYEPIIVMRQTDRQRVSNGIIIVVYNVGVMENYRFAAARLLVVRVGSDWTISFEDALRDGICE
jgi:hypothetical protein